MFTGVLCGSFVAVDGWGGVPRGRVITRREWRYSRSL